MGDIQISTSNLRNVEVGRVVRFATGPFAGKLAAIVEIIDHKRVLVEGPSQSSPVRRHSAPLSNVSLTALVVDDLVRASGPGAVKKVWDASKVEGKWAQTTQAKAADRLRLRRSLNDFQRYKLMRLQKKRSALIKVETAKIRTKA